jgi:hypothetical protein
MTRVRTQPNTRARTYIRPLAQGGRNSQGVPIGLVNYMNLNRSQHMPEEPLLHYDTEGGTEPLIEVVWNQLALSRPEEPNRVRGFFTMYLDTWRNY